MPRTTRAMSVSSDVQPLEQAARVALENVHPVLGGQVLDAFDHWFEIVVGPACGGILAAATPWSLRAEHAAARTDNVEQQFERLLVMQDRVEPEPSQRG